MKVRLHGEAEEELSEAADVVVLAIAHVKRQPLYWIERAAHDDETKL